VVRYSSTKMGGSDAAGVVSSQQPAASRNQGRSAWYSMGILRDSSCHQSHRPWLDRAAGGRGHACHHRRLGLLQNQGQRRGVVGLWVRTRPWLLPCRRHHRCRQLAYGRRRGSDDPRAPEASAWRP